MKQSCGKNIKITNSGSNSGVGSQGNSVVALVADTCAGCDENDVDISRGAWGSLTNGAVTGTIVADWYVTGA